VLFDSNGAGLAVGDLDGDGRLDIVLADLAGQLTVLWNETPSGGALRFEAASLPLRGAQAVVAVDVDGNGRLDVVTSQRGGGVARLRNLGDREFGFASLPGVHAPAYAIAWGDLDGDGRLDLVAASYDAEREREYRDGALFGAPGGVFVFYARDDGFERTRLRDGAQALALLLMDATGDGRDDVVVGHDFFIQDDVFSRDVDGVWQRLRPFARTSANTMSLDGGDVLNVGLEALFATDMKPTTWDPATLAAWMPLMQKSYERDTAHDGHRAANTLNLPQRGGWREQAAQRGVDATGWSWAGRFGDLDNDGWLDLYVATGMIAHDLLHYLPGGELRERDVALRNRGAAAAGHFVSAPEWGLGSDASGRAVVLADLTGDGRLDVVINTLESPALLFENRLCGGNALSLDLRWPDSPNTHAVGARVEVEVPGLGILTRRVRAGAGYLSGDPPRLHLGLGDATGPFELLVRWPDGATSRHAVEAGEHLTVTRVERQP
jgi:enediyne biosynthesis protein E4